MFGIIPEKDTNIIVRSLYIMANYITANFAAHIYIIYYIWAGKFAEICHYHCTESIVLNGKTVRDAKSYKTLVGYCTDLKIQLRDIFNHTDLNGERDTTRKKVETSIQRNTYAEILICTSRKPRTKSFTFQTSIENILASNGSSTLDRLSA